RYRSDGSGAWRRHGSLAKGPIYCPGFQFLSWQFLIFDKKMKVKISQIAELIHADIDGNPEDIITHPDKIETAQAGSITFFSNPKYEKYLYTTRATAILLDKEYHLSQPVPATLL